MNAPLALTLSLLCLPALLAAQDSRVFYYPKPLARTPWQAPMKPVTRLADVKAKHRGEPGWREPVIQDENSRAFLVQEPAGTTHARKLYPDSPAWWAVLDGRIRFEVEKPDRTFEVFEATKGSYVFVPERMLHAFAVVGDLPAISFEVTLASATPVYPDRPATAPPGVEYIPVRLSTGPNPLDVPDPNGKPWPIHFNVYDLATQNEGEEELDAGSDPQEPGAGKPDLRPRRIRSTSGAEQPRPLPLGLRRVLGRDARGAALDVRGRRAGLDRRQPRETSSTRRRRPGTRRNSGAKTGLNCRLTSSTYPSANHFYDPAR